MLPEQIIHLLIIIHATMGGLALTAGLIALLVTKGSRPHKLSGKVFFYCLFTGSALSLVIAVSPHHESSFLFTIGIFTLYLISSGYRALRYKRPFTEKDLLLGKVISGAMLVAGAFMIGLPVYWYTQTHNIYPVLPVFGIIGILNALQDMRAFRNPERLKKGWLAMHLGKMTGGFIAATTAFIVVNNAIPGIYGWLAPTFVGGFYIAYWIRKIKR